MDMTDVKNIHIALFNALPAFQQIRCQEKQPLWNGGHVANFVF